MVRTRAGTAKLEEEGIPVSPSQSLPNEPRRRETGARRKKKPRRRPSVPPADDTSEPHPESTPELTPGPSRNPSQDPTNDPTQHQTRDSTTQPSEEPLQTRSTRRQTSKYTTSETQTKSRTYTTGETQTSIFPPYGLPQVPFPDQSEVQVQLGWNNPHLDEDERILSLNLPADIIPAMLSFVTQHPQVVGTDLRHQLEQSPFFQELIEDHDNDRVQILTVIPGAKKRKREEEPTIESIIEARIQRDQVDRDYLRNHPSTATDRERRRQARNDETQNILQECRASRANEPRPKRTCMKLVPELYDEEGNFRLGRYKKVEFELDDEPEVEPSHTDSEEQMFDNSLTENDPPQQHEPASTNDAAPPATEMTDKLSKLVEITEDPYNDSEIPYSVPLEETFPEEQAQTQTHAEPETPRARSWGLTSFIPSSVSKFIPFASLRTPPAIAPSQPSAPSEPQVLEEARPPPPRFRNMTRSYRLKRERETQEEGIFTYYVDDDSRAADSGPHHQVAKPDESQKPKEALEQELRAEIEAEYKAKALEESEKLTVALKQKVNEVNKHHHRVERERVKIAQHLDEIIPGNKRKRMPSPESIPNPVAGGYGMDLDYFYMSDADSDMEDETPLRKPQTKRARTSSHEAELLEQLTGNHQTPKRRHQTNTKTARTSSHEAELLGESTGIYETLMRSHQTPIARTSSHEAELMGGLIGTHETPMRSQQTTIARTSLHEAELMGGSTGNLAPPMRRARTSLHEAELLRASAGDSEASSISHVGLQTIATSSFDNDFNISPFRNLFDLSAQTTPETSPGPTMTFKVPSPTSSDDDSALDLESPQGVTAAQSPLAPKQRPATIYSTMPAPPHLVDKARQKALMHQPKTGSSLRNARRLSSSIGASVEEQSKAEDTAECENIYEDYLTTHTSAYEEFMKGVSPKVAELMKATWTEADNKAAEKAFARGMEDINEAESEDWINGELEAWEAAQITGAAA